MTSTSECCRPNFFLIGAAKSGTTSIAKYLDEHPEVFVSKPKEPNFFAFEPNSVPTCLGPGDSDLLFELLLKYTITSPDDYSQLFAGSRDSIARGEASVRYLYDAQAPMRLANYAPDAKLIVLLRNPIDRLHSHYHMNLRKHLEPAALREAIASEDDRVEQGWGWDWHYRRVGNYAQQLETWFEHFDRSQVLILFHADLNQKPIETLRKIYQHLGVAADFEPNVSRRALVGHTPRWQLLRRIIRDDNLLKTAAQSVLPNRLRKSFVSWSESKNRKAIPQLDTQLRQALDEDYREANQHLEDLLGCQLPW